MTQETVARMIVVSCPQPNYGALSVYNIKGQKDIDV